MKPFTRSAWLVLALFQACASTQGRRPSSAELPDPGLGEWPRIESYGATYGARPACREFVTYFTGKMDEDEGLKTDALLVIQDGKILFEWTDGVYKNQTPHCLWSASKTYTMALVGAAVQEGRLSLDQKLSEYFPQSARKNPNHFEFHYPKVSLRDLVFMGAGFDWNESYEGAISESHVLRMLYTEGYLDVAGFASRAQMRPEGPMGRWVYSGGNSNLLMATLGKVYPENADRFPWTILFDKLGMKNVTFERDPRGTFIGSSYIHTTPRDMARLGQLFLKDGVWSGARLLPEGWMAEMRKVSTAQLAEATPIDYIKEEGVFGGTLWLNDAIRGLPRPFPNSPSDTFLAAGHYGQVIIALPTQRMLIVRTGHDKEYWSKIDSMITKTLDCFAPETRP